MKELSMEEKAKRYDEAIEVARKIKNGEPINVPDGTLIPVAIFPELRESEDEKMRKGIIRNLEYLMDRAEGFVKDELKERIAWLEKQGEQKSAEFKPSFRVGDVIKPKDPVLGEPRIIKGIHPKFGYDTNNGILDFEFEDNWEAVEEPVSDGLEEASKNYALNNTPWDDCKDEIQEAFKVGVKWQKEKDESTTEDLGEYINELSKQFPEVSFAKLSRIAVRVAKWQEQKYKEALNIYLNSQWNKGK